MVLKFLRIAAAAAAVAWGADRVMAQSPTPAEQTPVVQTPAGGIAPAAPAPAPPGPVATTLFYNYYVGGGQCQPASMYPCPRPTPPFVGHTYITYQPLMPHEFLYTHARTYDTYHGNGQITRTRVSWNHWPGLPTIYARYERPY